MTTPPPSILAVPPNAPKAEQLRAFSILNDIRDMGICNMFGAVSPLMEMGGLLPTRSSHLPNDSGCSGGMS